MLPLVLRIRQALEHRSISYPSDEAIWVANLAEFPLAEIMDVGDSAAGRMQVVWRRMTDIPRGLIFSGVHRLEMKGFRWAPVSFLGHQDERFCENELETAACQSPYQGMQGLLTPRGLQVKFPGFLFVDGVDSPASVPIDFQDEYGDWYQIFTHHPVDGYDPSDEKYKCQFDAIVLPSWPTHSCEKSEDGTHTASLEAHMYTAGRKLNVDSRLIPKQNMDCRDRSDLNVPTRD